MKENGKGPYRYSTVDRFVGYYPEYDAIHPYNPNSESVRNLLPMIRDASLGDIFQVEYVHRLRTPEELTVKRSALDFIRGEKERIKVSQRTMKSNTFDAAIENYKYIRDISLNPIINEVLTLTYRTVDLAYDDVFLSRIGGIYNKIFASKNGIVYRANDEYGWSIIFPFPAQYLESHWKEGNKKECRDFARFTPATVLNKFEKVIKSA